MSNIVSREKEIRKLRRELREIKKYEALLKADIKTLKKEMKESSVLSGSPIGLKSLSALFRLQKK